MWSMVYKGEDLRLIICACYSWEMALIFGFNVHSITWTVKNTGESKGTLIVRKRM
jgi:hypothetical protein